AHDARARGQRARGHGRGRRVPRSGVRGLGAHRARHRAARAVRPRSRDRLAGPDDRRPRARPGVLPGPRGGTVVPRGGRARRGAGMSTPRAARSTASLRHRLAERGIDLSLLMLVPAVVLTTALFIYPFSYGIGLTFQPNPGIQEQWGGGVLANYRAFFGDAF